jgi:hypothetical protein
MLWKSKYKFYVTFKTVKYLQFLHACSSFMPPYKLLLRHFPFLQTNESRQYAVRQLFRVRSLCLSSDEENQEPETETRNIYEIWGSHGVEDVDLPTSPHGVTTQKTNRDKENVVYLYDRRENCTALWSVSKHRIHMCKNHVGLFDGIRFESWLEHLLCQLRVF